MAKRYRRVTGRSLGITGEVAEFAAAQHLNLRLAPAQQSGYDATKTVGGRKKRYQIKGRCIPKGAKTGGRLGRISLDKEWDSILLVVLDEDLELVDIYEANRQDVKKALLAPGSKARNERGALAVNKFKSIGKRVWTRKVR